MQGNNETEIEAAVTRIQQYASTLGGEPKEQPDISNRIRETLGIERAYKHVRHTHYTFT